MAQRAALVDYGSGNLHSAAKAVQRAAREAGVDIALDVTGDVETVRRADRIVLPGVGAFGDCMAGLRAIDGMADCLDEKATSGATPLLGICVGMQLMAEAGQEHGHHAGFGWVKGTVRALRPADATLKIPHMGWNALEIAPLAHPVLSGLGDGTYVYFVHSYHLEGAGAGVKATANYGGPVTACVASGTCFGTQFHPEKSQNAGLRLLGNFLKWAP